MDFELVKTRGDLKQVGHLMPIQTLARFAALNPLYRRLCVGWYADEIYVHFKNGGYCVHFDGSRYEWYEPECIFHDGPMYCKKLELENSCIIPAEAVQCEQLLFNWCGPEVLPLIHRRLKVLRFECETPKQYFISLSDLLTHLGYELYWLQFPLDMFPDGYAFADLINEFQNRTFACFLEKLTLQLPSVESLLEVLQDNVNFFADSDFLRVSILKVEDDEMVPAEDVEKLKKILAGRFCVHEGSLGKLRVFVDDDVWIDFKVLPEIDDDDEIISPIFPADTFAVVDVSPHEAVMEALESDIELADEAEEGDLEEPIVYCSEIESQFCANTDDATLELGLSCAIVPVTPLMSLLPISSIPFSVRSVAFFVGLLLFFLFMIYIA